MQAGKCGLIKNPVDFAAAQQLGEQGPGLTSAFDPLRTLAVSRCAGGQAAGLQRLSYTPISVERGP
jgi:hypothetical protein